jgi:HD-GYP domain-containing protein (c-di-GMP phosphodiesterase class II)
MSEDHSMPRLVVGEDTASKSEDRARELLLAFSQLLQVSRFHDLENVALREPLENVAGLTEELCSRGRRLELAVDEGQVFLNRRRVRLTTGAFRSLGELVRRLEERQLAGFEIREPLTPGELRVFLHAFHGAGRETEDAADRLEAALAEGGVTQITLVRPGGAVQAAPATIEVDEGTLSALLYAKAVVVLRESLRCWEDEPTRRYFGARARRVVQEIITRAEANPRPFLWLVHVKDEEEYLYTHSANVALLSILVGLRLGLDRNLICDLGTCALFHDMGKVALPPELLGKKGKYTEDERAAMARHPIHGVNMLLGLGLLNETILRRLVTVFEYNIVANGYPREDWGGDLHVFSRIVAIADAYDAMTTRKSYRPALTPAEAMRELNAHAGSRYDADLVQLFTGVLGVYPLGTLVRLDTGEAGLVFHVDPATPRRPLVRLVVDAEGNRLEDGGIVDLGETVDGRPVRSIVGTDDPIRLGVHVPAYLAEPLP